MKEGLLLDLINGQGRNRAVNQRDEPSGPILAGAAPAKTSGN
jgi:hypothetical protein